MGDMVFKWKEQFGNPADPQIVGERWERLRLASDGMLTPAAVVEDAARQDAPTHCLFEWDDTKAAAAYRLRQAGDMFRNLKCELILGKDGPAITTRYLVNVNTEKKGGYISIVSAMEDREMRKQIVSRALRELNEWRARYRAYKELGEFFATIDRIGEKIGSELEALSV